MCALQPAGHKGHLQNIRSRAAPYRRPNLSTRQRTYPGCITQYESFVRKQLAAAYEAVAERTLDTSVAAYQTRQAVRIAEEEQPPKARPKRPRKAPMSQLEGLMATAGPASSRPAAVSFFGCRHLWAQLREDGEERLAWLLQAISDAFSAFDESGQRGSNACGWSGCTFH